jgi:hypothetical protein
MRSTARREHFRIVARSFTESIGSMMWPVPEVSGRGPMGPASVAGM